MFFIRCLDSQCHLHDSKTLSSRDSFFRSHVVKKSTSRIIEILNEFDLVTFPNLLGRYTLANIFTDFCREPIASSIIEGGDSNT